MWVIFAFVSATIVGIRDSFKKSSLQGNDVLTVLFLSTLFSAAAALYDKFVMGRPEDGGMGNSVMFIQSWYNSYQTALLLLILRCIASAPCASKGRGRCLSVSSGVLSWSAFAK